MLIILSRQGLPRWRRGRGPQVQRRQWRATDSAAPGQGEHEI